VLRFLCAPLPLSFPPSLRTTRRRGGCTDGIQVDNFLTSRISLLAQLISSAIVLSACGGGGSAAPGADSPAVAAQTNATTSSVDSDSTSTDSEALATDSSAAKALETSDTNDSSGAAAPVAIAPTTVTGLAVYVDSLTGNDSNSGLASSPWRTLARVNNARLPAGSAVLLKCGSVWRESLVVTNTTFTANSGTVGIYGSCTDTNKPLITGADSISGLAWSLASGFSSGPVYTAKASQPVSQLYWNGTQLTQARMPNSRGIGAEFSLIKSASGANTFVVSDADRAAIGSSNLVGATVVIRTEAWKFETSTVQSYDAATGRVTLATSLITAPKAGEGYYLEGKPFMLDAPGEWAYDPSTGYVYVRTPSDVSPAGGMLESANRATGVTVQYVSNIRFENLRLDMHTGTAFIGRSAPGTVLQGVDVRYPGNNGISITSGDSSVLNSTVISAPSNGILVDGPRIVVKGNTISNTGVGPFARNPQGAIHVVSEAGSIVDNKVNTSGYVGITIGRSPGITVSNNDIARACARVTDCGAIYSWGAPLNTTRSAIKNNHVHDMTPNLEGAVGGAPSLVAGIYLDEKSAYYDVSDNLIHDIGVTTDLSAGLGQGAGVNLHNSSFNTIQGNTIWGVSRASVRAHASNDGGIDRVRGNVVTGNTLLATTYQKTSAGSAVPSAQMVYAQEWVHFTDSTQMFTGTDANRSSSNAVVALGSTGAAKWLASDPFATRNLSAAQWATFSAATGETVRLPYASRPLLAAYSSANLIQNQFFMAPSTPWSTYISSGSVGASVAFATCGDGKCADFKPGSNADQLNSNEFAMSGTAGNNVYLFQMRAVGLASNATVGMRLHRMYGDWGTVGYEVPSMSLPMGEETRVEQLFVSTANDADRIRLDFRGSTAQTYQLREAAVYKVSSFELYNPWTETALLSNSGDTVKTFTCAEAGVRSCTAIDSNGNAVVWPVTVAPHSALIVISADSKWRY